MLHDLLWALGRQSSPPRILGLPSGPVCSMLNDWVGVCGKG